MYKIKIKDLESVKKQLKTNNLYLNELMASKSTNISTSKIKVLINGNEKQIKLLEEEYYIGK